MEIKTALTGIFVGLFGAAVGSFLNVVIYRLPRDQSIIRPRSRCPACGHPIRWYHNLPLLSFFLLKGRCRDCHQPISYRYPLVEALASGLALALWLRFGLSREFLVHFAFAGALIAVAFIDLDHRIIPNQISLPGIAVAFACSFLWGDFWKDSLIGLLVGGGGLLLLSLLYALVRGREGMGMGDVKLLGMLGAWLGWQGLPFILLAASVQGVLLSLVLWLSGVKLKAPLPEEWEEEERAGSGGSDRSGEEPAPSFLLAAIPFGPFLALGALEYLFLGGWFYGWLRGGV